MKKTTRKTHHKEKVVSYTGNATWLYSDGDHSRAETSEAISRNNCSEIVADFDFSFPGYASNLYTTKLTLTDQGKHLGVWFDQGGHKGSCEGILYSNDSGLVLIGHWIEGGERSDWILVLHQIK